MTITISADLEARLREKATQEGKAVDEVVEALLAAALDWEAVEQADAVAGIQRGIEASAAGRVRSLSQVIVDARQRHGFPESWPFDTDPA
jgi:predicted transcriptional regulator